MCVMSMVMDDFYPRIPDVSPWPTTTPEPWFPVPSPFVPQPTTLDLAALLDAFRKAVKDARQKDIASGAPDCVDPLKEKLIARVAELEKLLNEAPEFVLVNGANLVPGRYRVVCGKLAHFVDDVPPTMGAT